MYLCVEGAFDGEWFTGGGIGMSYEGSATGFPTLFPSTLKGGVDGGTSGSGDAVGVPPGMIGRATGDFCLEFPGGNGPGAIGSAMGASLFDAFLF